VQDQLTMKKTAGALILTVFCASGTEADDWPAAAAQNIFSESGRYFVRIVPGQSIGDSVGFAGATKGRYARGEFYARQPNRSYALVADVILENPVSPTDALVTNRGYLVTFDNWHNLGYGTVVAIYAPTGRTIRTFTLEQLYSEDRLERIPRSVSSRWWRCAPRGFVDPDEQTEIYLFEHFGGTFTFKLQNGAFAYQPDRATCAPPAGPFSTSWFGR
jgi:hypothetical protein